MLCVKEVNGFFGFVLLVKKFYFRGIKFKLRMNIDLILDIRFRNGVFYIFLVVMDDFIVMVFLNCVVFE